MADPTRTAQQVWQSGTGEDFLQLIKANGGGIQGWIDSNGVPQGNLFAGGGVPQFATYIFSVSNGITSARNNATGNVDFSGADAAVVINAALAVCANTGGLFYFKNGIYNLSSVTLDSITGIYSAITIPGPSSTSNQVQWHFVGESAPFLLSYAVVGRNGVIFNLTTAAETMAGAGTNISVIYQQANASGLGSNLFFKNLGGRIPSNQRGKEIIFDATNGSYSQWENCLADTNVAAIDQLGSGLALSAVGNSGFRTIASGENETYLVNCWSIGFRVGYSIDSEHSYLYNCRASFNSIAAQYGSGTNSVFHPSIWIHFQDIHNANGIFLGGKCQKGSRLDLLNTDIEYVTSGTYNRIFNAQETNAGNTSGRVTSTTVLAFVGITNANGPFFSIGGSNFQVEESAKIYPLGVFYTTFTPAPTTGTSKQTLATFTFSAGPQGNDGSLFQSNTGAVVRIKAWGITAANGNSKTVELDFGGTAIANVTSTASSGAVELEVDIIVSGNSSQDCIGKCIDSAGTNSLSYNPLSITSTAAIVLNLAATTPTASGDFTFKGMSIEYLGGK